MIIAILGASGSGKTTLQEEMLQSKFFKQMNYSKAISTTTRPRREGESEDAYHFVSEEEFETLKKANKFIEIATYNNWHYGLQKDDLQGNQIVVVTPHGLRMLLNQGFNIYSIYIDVDRKSRLIKLLETRDDIDECYRRNLSDIGMFDGLIDHFNIDLIINNDAYMISAEEIMGLVRDDFFKRLRFQRSKHIAQIKNIYDKLKNLEMRIGNE